MSFRKITGLFGVLVCVFVAFVSFSACSKDDDGGPGKSDDYYFKATFNGKAFDFTHTAKFQGGGNDGRWEHIVLGGYEAKFPTDGSQLPPSYDIELWRVGGNIGVGKYESALEKEMISRYAIQTNNGTLLYNTLQDGDNFILNIESISDKGIRGTFGGTIRNDAGAAIEVKDGSFNLPYDELVNP